MAIDFPTSPTLNEIYSYGGRSWQWNGIAWDIYSPAGGLTQYVSKLNGLCGSINIAAGTSISVTPAGNTLTIAYTGTGGGGGGPTMYVESFNGLTGAVTGVTVGGTNVFTALNTFNAGISAAGSSFSSTTNTIDIIASTDGAGLRIAQATTGSASRIGGIRLGRNANSSLNTYLESSAGIFTIYNGVGATGTKIVDFTTTATGFSGAVSATGLISSTTGFSGSGTNLTNIVKTLNGLSGGVTLAAGTNITLVPTGNTITINSSGGGSGVDAAFVIAMATVL